MNDSTLAAAQHGDRQAQAELLRELQDSWFRLCCGILGNGEAAKDATQETALRFIRQLPQFRGESQLRTWALGIAINVAREEKRSAARSVVRLRLTSDRRQPRAADVEAELAEQSSVLRDSLQHLPDRQKEALMLRYFEGLSVEQTASAMECAVGTIKATIHQALRSLRQRMRQFQ